MLSLYGQDKNLHIFVKNRITRVIFLTKPLRLIIHTDMKKCIATTLIVLAACLGAFAQSQPRYLTRNYKPVNSYCYKAGSAMEIYGGLKWSNGFSIGNTVGPYKAGYATFRVGGQYDKLTFVLGLKKGSYGSDPRIVTVYADGKKVMDQVVRMYGIHQRMTLDIKGANELKFMLTKGEGTICFAEVALWKAGETPRETGNLLSGKPQKKMLFKDILPYTMENHSALEDGGHWLISPQSKYKSVSVGNKKYNYGLEMIMTMAMIGNNEAQTHLNLRGQYATLSFIAGPVNTGKASNGVGWITIKGDGKILHEYEVKQDDIARRITLDVTGVHQLSFFSQQESMGLHGAIVDAWVYPAGEAPDTSEETTVSEVDPRLKLLPDVCKLISNIPPYSTRSDVEYQVYTGTSDYITFSMGGVKFNEGFILYEKASFWDDNLISYAAFDLGNEFDYVSFTAGYVGKSWVMNNDKLRVYADDELILEAPLNATSPNQEYVLPLNKCRKLRFENGGQGTMNVGAYGVADLVVYRGKPVDNDLFPHPVPDCPHEIDLIDLGKPYIHYVSTARSGVFHDGSTKKEYFTLRDGTRLYKGFMLQTSTHFSLDHGVLSGTDNTMAATIGATAVGSSFVVAGAVGNTFVGSTLAGVAAFMILAAGGEAVENSCAAFNTYGQYNSLTFTVDCLRTAEDSQLLGPDTWQADKSEYKETLLIGADQVVVAELSVYESMKPQTITVPINGCKQLMFWLANTAGNSGQFVFYDLKLSKDACELDIPEDARSTQAEITSPIWSGKSITTPWPRQKATGAQTMDTYFRDLAIASETINKCLKDYEPDYDICTYYLETEAGQTCKAIKLRYKPEEPDDEGRLLPGPGNLRAQVEGGFHSIIEKHKECHDAMTHLNKLKGDLTGLTVTQASAYVELPSLGLAAIKYGKLMKQSAKTLKELKTVLDAMCEEKKLECLFLDTVIGTAINIDGRQSSEKTIFCPLFDGEVPPEGDKMMVRNFSL